MLHSRYFKKYLCTPLTLIHICSTSYPACSYLSQTFKVHQWDRRKGKLVSWNRVYVLFRLSAQLVHSHCHHWQISDVPPLGIYLQPGERTKPLLINFLLNMNINSNRGHGWAQHFFFTERAKKLQVLRRKNAL